MSTYQKLVRDRVERYAVTEEVELQDLIGTLLGRNVTPELAGNLAAKGVRALVDLTVQELVMYGIAKRKAIELHASFLLAKKLLVANTKEKKTTIRSPHDAATYLVKELAGTTQEHFGALFLNTKNEVICKKTLFIGPINSCVVHSREIFHEAVKNLANSIVLFHTHPSGHCTPSAEDIEVTKNLADAGELMGITLVDHLILGQDTFLSMKEKGYF